MLSCWKPSRWIHLPPPHNIHGVPSTALLVLLLDLQDMGLEVADVLANPLEPETGDTKKVYSPPQA